MRDWADDVAALVDALGLERVPLVGWSMGAGVVLQYLLDAPGRVASVALRPGLLRSGRRGARLARGRACPPQPMVGRTRAVLDRYAASGGSYRQVVLPDVGHSPHVERPQEFVVALLEHLDVPAEPPTNLT